MVEHISEGNSGDNGNHGDDRKKTFGYRCPKVLRIIGMVVGGVVLAVLFAFVFGLVVKLLWNALMPAIFGLSIITYWQAVGLVILAKLIFGGFGHGHHHDRHDRFPRKFAHKGNGFSWCPGDYEGDVWKPKGSYKNWKYYDRYWKEEGKAAFEDYIDRVEAREKGE